MVKSIEDNESIINFMDRAIHLASLAEGCTSPNPLVGAVVTDKNRKLIGEGFHPKTGMPHAEVFALNQAGEKAKGGSLFVNLEPCCHYGRTPPCVEKIISSGIKNVYVAMKDPDPRVSGKGIKKLRDAGLNVFEGILDKKSKILNRAFIYRVTNGKSYGVLKWAMTIDGRISLPNGKSKWITCEDSRNYVHNLRSKFDAIVIGGETLRSDNPLLTTRNNKDKEPLRVVFTRSCDLPNNSQVWDCNLAETIIVFPESSDYRKLESIPKSVEKFKLKSDNPHELSIFLAEKGINQILWECGPELSTSAMKSGCIQEIKTFIAPKIIGGNSARTPFCNFGFKEIDNSYEFLIDSFSIHQKDLLVEMAQQINN
tara:strand:- start:17452 stop:18558 length:1107 start_codon:yes stop_codon:yes gene_type:complete